MCTFHRIRDKDRPISLEKKREKTHTNIHKSITVDRILLWALAQPESNWFECYKYPKIDRLYRKSKQQHRPIKNGEDTNDSTNKKPSTTKACKSYLPFSQAKYVIKCSCTAKRSGKKSIWINLFVLQSKRWLISFVVNFNAFHNWNEEWKKEEKKCTKR